MRKSRFTESQIVAILKEADIGMKVGELCRKYGISDATYYKWKSKCGGMEASDLKRVRELEAENSRLKRMYADLALENTAMKDLIEKSCNADREARGSKVPGWTSSVTRLPLLRMRRASSVGVLPGAGALDGSRRRGNCCAGLSGGGAAEPGLLEVPQAAQAPGLSMESQAHLSGV